MGNLIFGTTTVQGRTFDDIKVQTSKEGVPRPIVFGTARPIVGNIIATTAPRIEKNKEEQGGGKGSPSVEVVNEEIFRSYAIRICEGPVTGIKRVWRNNELVYVGTPLQYVLETYPDLDPATAVLFADIIVGNSVKFLNGAEFFLGGYDQMPSAIMEAQFGAENVHAYRGTCYMVVNDENLTATGGAIPQYAFEVERCEGFSLTSRPYAVEHGDSLLSQYSDLRSPPAYIIPEESMNSYFSGVAGVLRVPLVDYDNYVPEAIDSEFISLLGTLTIPLVDYDNYAPEAIDSTFLSVSGDLNQVLITYEQYLPEAIDSSFQGITGILS